MALTTASTLSVNKAMYEQVAYLALRPELYFDALATVKASDQGPKRGTSVTFTFNNDLAPATTALTDGTDITPVAMSDSQVTVTPAEYGNAIQLTAKNKATAFYELNPLAADLIGWNAGLSVDQIAATTAVTGNKVVYVGQINRTSLTKSNILVGNNVRAAKAYMKKYHVKGFNGLLKGIMHPDVVYDFTGQTGGTNWSDPHVYQDTSGIYNGVIGTFQGVQFMEVDRDALVFADASANTFTISTITVSGNTATLTTSAAHGLIVEDTLTISGATSTSGTGSTSQVGFNAQFTVLTVPSTTTLTVDITGKTATCNAGTSLTLVVTSIDAYATLILGQQAIAKAYTDQGGYSINPVLGDVPVTDVLQRITGVYWKHFVGYGVFRQKALYRIETASAIGQ